MTQQTNVKEHNVINFNEMVAAAGAKQGAKIQNNNKELLKGVSAGFASIADKMIYTHNNEGVATLEISSDNGGFAKVIMGGSKSSVKMDGHPVVVLPKQSVQQTLFPPMFLNGKLATLLNEKEVKQLTTQQSIPIMERVDEERFNIFVLHTAMNYGVEGVLARAELRKQPFLVEEDDSDEEQDTLYELRIVDSLGFKYYYRFLQSTGVNTGLVMLKRPKGARLHETQKPFRVCVGDWVEANDKQFMQMLYDVKVIR